MRKIKFRAWFPDGKRVVSIDPDDIYYVIDEGGTVMQFTGLHDKNGVEIYEGDIVRITDLDEFTPEWPFNAVIKYKGYCFTPYSAFDGNYEREVIGNIYENPELLENSDD